MFVSSYLIYSQIKKYFSCKIHKKYSYDLVLGAVEIAESILKPEMNTVYIIDFHCFDEKPKKEITCAVSIGTPKQALIGKCGFLIELPEDTPVAAVLNRILGVFQYYGKWDNALKEILLRGGSVDDMMEAAAPIFGNPIGVHDATLICVAETDYAVQNDENIITQHRKDPLYINNIIADPDYIESLRRSGAFLMASPTNPQHKCLIRNIFLNGEFTYRIVISERYRLLEEQDARLLDVFASYIIPLLTPLSWQNSAPPLSILLDRIISGVSQNPQIMSQCFQARGWKSDCYYLCLVFNHSDIDIFENIEKAICQRIRQLIPNSEVFLHEKTIVCIVNLGGKKILPNRLTPFYVEFMRDMNMKCGISSVMRGQGCFQAQYVQACNALRIGHHLYQHLWQFYFDDIAPYYMMERCSHEMPVEAVCASEIRAMAEYDATHDTEYFQTVKEYLDCSMNLSRAAERLFIHRATLIYRLKKIDELFHCDFKSPIKRVYYHFSVQMLSYSSLSFSNLSGMNGIPEN